MLTDIIGAIPYILLIYQDNQIAVSSFDIYQVEFKNEVQ